MSKQNIIPFDRFHSEINSSGSASSLNEDCQLLFQQNFQFLRNVLSEDGHLTPERSNADIEALSTDQYTTRYAYNTDTHNAMTNIEGVYRNITTTLPLSHPAKINPNRFEIRIGKNGEVYNSANGELKQSVLSNSQYSIFLDFEEGKLILEINGKKFHVELIEVSEKK